MTRKTFISLLFLLFFFLPLVGQELKFSSLNSSHGLSQNSVTSMASDSVGRIWIGTRNGLNVYDGIEIKSIFPVRGDSSSMLGHCITKLFHEGNRLWISTYSGLSCLDLKTLQFKRFSIKGVVTIASLNGVLWLGSQNGLLEQNKTTGTFRSSSIIPAGTAVQYLTTDDEGSLWISTAQGTYRYRHGGDGAVKVSDLSPTVIFFDSRHRIWMGTFTKGAYILNEKCEIIRHIAYPEQLPSALYNNVRDIQESRLGEIWVGTFGGLSVINPDDFSVNNYVHSQKDQTSLSHNSIYCILRDQQDGMWLGTYYGGVSYVKAGGFKKYRFFNQNKEEIIPIVGEIIEDKDKNLYIATEGDGLFFYDTKKNRIEHYALQGEGQRAVSQNIRALHLRGKALFIGTHLGELCRLSLNNKKLHIYNSVSDSLNTSFNMVDDIISLKGEVLLATEIGLLKFDPSTEHITYFLDKAALRQKITCIFEDSFGWLWIGTEKGGLYAYVQKTGKLIHYRSIEDDLSTISGENVSCIFEDRQLRLWVGTLGKGLNLFDREKNSFACMSKNTHGLPSDFILGLADSGRGNIWVSTSNSLSLLNTAGLQFLNYTQQAGFPLSELNLAALRISSKGELFVGGINGLVSVSEQHIFAKPRSLNLTFSSLTVNNKAVKPGDDTGILRYDLPYTQKISLQPGQNVFTIAYSALNYFSAPFHTYHYKLEGFDNQWVNAGNRTKVTYTNLSPGKYRLKIKLSSGIGKAVVDEKHLDIEVIPPWHKTHWAMAAYIIIAILLVWGFAYLFKAKLILAEQIKYKQKENEQIKLLNQQKLIFFTNISHEFRTPLTIIKGTLDTLLSDTKVHAQSYRKLLRLNKQTSRMLNLVNELLDFRKLENGKLGLKPEKVDFVRFIQEIYHSFEEYAQCHHIDFELKTPPSIENVVVDGTQMEKVFYNLLANAFKYIENESGKVLVTVADYNDCIEIDIEDNGIGIPKNRVKKIFDRYYQIDNISEKTKGKGSGIGLSLAYEIVKAHKGSIAVESEEGEGANFKVRLPKGQALPDLPTNTGNATAPALEHIPAYKPEQTTGLETPEKLPDKALKLLIVDDNKEIRLLLKQIFETSYHIVEANDGKIGIEQAIKEQPDLIISDVMMPKVSGNMLCATLKRNILTCHIPIILLTAKSSVEFKIEGLETGADDYITKPFSSLLLKTRVSNLLQNRALLRKNYQEDPKSKISDISPNTLDQQLLEKAGQTVSDHMDNDAFNVRQFAEAMNMSRSNLFLKIKGITGMTPNDFILSVRLKKAAEMLIGKGSGLSITEIAYAVGFKTARHFSQCFKDYFGISPSLYGERGNAARG